MEKSSSGETPKVVRSSIRPSDRMFFCLVEILNYVKVEFKHDMEF